MQGNCQCEIQQLADGTIIAQTTTNGFGQVVVTAQPNTLGGFICTRSEYNTRGLLVKSFRDTGLGTEVTAPTHYEYDAMGNVVKQTLALAELPSPANSPITETSFGAESLEDSLSYWVWCMYSDTMASKCPSEVLYGMSRNTPTTVFG